MFLVYVCTGGRTNRTLFSSRSLPLQQPLVSPPPAAAAVTAEGDPFTLAAATAKQQLAQARAQAQAHAAAHREAQQQISELQQQLGQANADKTAAEERAAVAEEEIADLRQQLAAAEAKAAAAADREAAATRERDGMVAATAVMREKLEKMAELEQEVQRLQWQSRLDSSLSVAQSTLAAQHISICAELNSQMLAAQRYLQDEAIRLAILAPPPLLRQQQVDDLDREKYLTHLLVSELEDAEQRAVVAEADASDLYQQLMGRQRQSRKRKASDSVATYDHMKFVGSKLRSHLSYLHDIAVL